MISTHFFITTIKIREHFNRSEDSNCKIKQGLWFSFEKTLLVLWHEISYIWNRQPKESDCTIPSICASLHPENIDYVWNWNGSGPYFGWKWTSVFIHGAQNRLH